MGPKIGHLGFRACFALWRGVVGAKQFSLNYIPKLFPTTPQPIREQPDQGAETIAGPLASRPALMGLRGLELLLVCANGF